MKKIFYLIFAALCIVACSEKNTPTNPEGNNTENPGENPGGENPGTNKELVLLIKESIRNIKQHDQTAQQRSHIVYEYDSNYRLVKQKNYGLEEELTQEETFTWNGRERIGQGTLYRNGSSYGFVYDTIKYINDKYNLYSSISTNYVYESSANWTVNKYEYEGDKLKKHAAYISGKLYRVMDYSYSGYTRYGIGNNYDNASGSYDTDTTIFNDKWLIKSAANCYLQKTGAKTISRYRYEYKSNAEVFEQLTMTNYENTFYNDKGEAYFSSNTITNYTWKGDSIRYGVSADGITTDTTYYYVIRR